MLPLTIWMDAPSFHQNDLFEALAHTGQVDLRVIFASGLPAFRTQLGWTEPPRNDSHYILKEGVAWWDALRLAWSQRRRLHIINGIWAKPAFALALCMLGLTRARFIVYAESPDPAQNRSLLKRAVQRAFGRWVAKRASGFLTVSHLACRYYRGLGFRTDQMYPFGYFRAQPSPLRSGRLNPDQTMEVLFIGQIIHRKGLDVLVKAMTPLFAEYGNLYLRVIGTGESINLLQDEVRSLGLQERVIFEGVLASDRIYSRLASVDVLVLPSRWDGWGMVINEAFAVGVPVIASDRCGAAELIHEGENGYVFRSEDVEDLHRCLHAFLRSRDDWPRFRAQAAATGNRISTAAVAPYLVACLENIAARSSRKPSPPWG